MFSKLPILDDVRIASPCEANWEAMSGDDRIRVCGDCQMRVYNLSEMNREEATALVAKAEGRLCVRFYRRADGTMLTRDCPRGLAAAAAYVRGMIASVVAMALFIGFTVATSIGRKTSSSPRSDNWGCIGDWLRPPDAVQGQVIQDEL